MAQFLCRARDTLRTYGNTVLRTEKLALIEDFEVGENMPDRRETVYLKDQVSSIEGVGEVH